MMWKVFLYFTLAEMLLDKVSKIPLFKLIKYIRYFT